MNVPLHVRSLRPASAQRAAAFVAVALTAGSLCLQAQVTIGTTSPLSPGVLAVGYSNLLSAAGGTAPYIFAWTGGLLPPGLSLSNDGLVSGTSTLVGSSLFTVRAVDTLGAFADKTFAMDVLNGFMPTGIVSWWKAEGNVQDTIGANHGSLLNGATHAAGPVGQAFSFDGVNDYVSVPDNAGLSPHTGGEMSLEAWVYLTEFPPVLGTVVGKTSPSNYEYALGVNSSGYAGLSLWQQFGSGYASAWSAGPVITLNRWHHLASTLRKGQFVRMYVDGTLVSESTAFSGSLLDLNGPLSIGQRGDNLYYLKGTVDEVTLYNRVLTTTEIQILHNSGPVGKFGFLSSNLLPASIGVGYSTTLAAIGGFAPHTFTVSAGALPPGMTLSSAGVLSGTSPVYGIYNFTVQLADNSGRTATRDFALNVRAFTGTSYTWNGSTGNWTDSARWTPSGVPGVNDEANINSGDVNVSAATEVAALNFNGGKLRGSGLLTVSTLMNWTGGEMQDSGWWRIPVGGVLNISGASGKGFLNGCYLENFGSVYWSGGYVYGGIFGGIGNRPGGIFEIRTDIYAQGVGFSFWNEGTLHKTTTTGTNIVDWHLLNYAALNIESGGLICDNYIGSAFNNSGTVTLATGTFLKPYNGTNSGVVNLASNAVLEFPGFSSLGNHLVNATFTGDGVCRMSSPANVYLSGIVSMSNFEMPTGELHGPGAVTISNVMNWTGGRVNDAGNIIIAATGTLNLSGSGTKLMFQFTALYNAGRVIVTGSGGLQAYDGSVINNLAGGLIELQADGGLYQSGSTPILNNSGTVRKTGSTGSTPINLRMNNAGVLDVQSGTLLFANAPVSTALNNSGALIIGNGSISVSGNYTSTPSATVNIALSGPAPVSQYGRLHVTGQAALNGALNVTLADGFMPVVGDTFLVVSNGTRTSSFSSVSELNLGGGRRFALSYPAQGTLLTTVTLGLSPGTLPLGYAGAPYSQTLSGANGIPAYSFAVTGGALPPGLSLSLGGVLSGTPSASGVFNFTVQVTDSAPNSATANYTLQVLACGLGALNSDLVSQWHGDGNANDSAGTNHGTLLNGATFTSGFVGQGFRFDGVNDLVDLGNNSAFRQSARVTYSFWARIPAGGGGYAMGTGAASGNGFGGVYLTQSRFEFWWTTSSPILDAGLVATGVNFPADTWMHLVVSVDFVNKTAALYVNGQLVPSTVDNNLHQPILNWVPVSSYNAGRTDSIGGRFVNSWTYFNGQLDEVLLYRRALSSSEVAALYNGGNPSCLDMPEFTTFSTQPNGRVGTPYWQTLTALLGHTPYSFAVTSGALPSGLTLSSAGVISGTPLVSGTSTFTITLTDSAGSTTQREFTLAVEATLPCVTMDGAWARWPAESNGVETINGFTASLSNGVTFTPGVVGQAFLFDGANDLVQASVPYLPNWLPGVSSDKNCAIELWMRMDAPAPAGGSWLAGWNDYGILVGGDQRLQIYPGLTQGPLVESGRWYHMVAVHESGYAKLYVDGALVANLAAGIPGSGSLLYLGQYPPGFGSTGANKVLFRGAIDEPTMFTRALSAAEVAAIYNAGSSGKCRSLNNTVANGTCEVVARKLAPGAVSVRGLAFDPWNQPVVAWIESEGYPYAASLSRWAVRTNGLWNTNHIIRQSGVIGGQPSALSFALRADGRPFFGYSVQNISIGNDSYYWGFYIVDGGLQPNGPGTLYASQTFADSTADVGSTPGSKTGLAFSPGDTTPDWVVPSFYNGVRQQISLGAGFDLFINDNGVHALINQWFGARMSRTAGQHDGPIITTDINGRSGNVAVTVDSNNVFHALISGLRSDADWANGKMVHATSLNGTNWNFADLGPGVDLIRSLCVDIAVSPDGQLGIAYYRVGKLWYAELINGHWVQTAVNTYSGFPEQVGAGSSDVFRLAFDRNGQPAIAIYDPGTTNVLLCRPAGLRHPPVAIPQNLTTPEDTALGIGLTGTDPDGDELTGTLLTTPAHGTLTGTMPVFTYTPNTNFFGADSFQFQVDDGYEGTSIATISITVTPVNDPPVANPQNLVTPEDTSLAVTLSASDVDDLVLDIIGVGTPTHGALTGIEPNLTYTPALNYHGPDTFTFTVADASNATSTATISISVTPVNDQPVADAQSVTTPEDTAVNITLTGSDVDGDTLNFIVTTPPAQGSLSGTAPNLAYTPALNYNGSDSLVFEVSDGHGGTASATVSITISSVNDTPTANAQSVTTDEDTAVNITLTGSDVDGDSLTFTVTTPPTHGSLSGTAPNLSYTPALNYNGSDSLVFEVNDGHGGTASATVSITISPVNDTPVANAQSVTTDEDTTVNIILTGSDVDGDSLTFTVTTPPAHGSLSGTAPNLSYAPALNYNGSDSLAFEVSDGHGGTASATVSITITPVNDTPAANAQSVSTAEDTAVNITLTGSDVDGDSLTFTVTTPPAHGSLSGTAPNLSYAPALNYNGSDSLAFEVSDGHGGTASATVSITITPVNDTPAANAQSVSTAEDTAVNITLTGSDVDGDSLTFTVTTPPAHGSLSGTAPNLSYAPALNYNGSDSLAFEVSDGHGGTASATVSITITPVNDTPAANAQSVSTAEDTAVNITLTGSDVDGDSLAFTATTPPTHGSLSGTAPNLTYAPALNYYGPDSFSFTVNDGHGGTATATISITVSALNDPPTASPQSVTTDQNVATAITLAGSDLDGDTLAFAVTTPPTHGSLSGTAPSLSYTPALNYNGPDTFGFEVSDGHGGSATATVNITVTATGTAPPTIVCPANVTVAITSVCGNTAPATNAVIAAFLNGASVIGGCAPVTIANNAPSAFPVGTNTVTFTGTDACGQTASCQAKVIVATQSANCDNIQTEIEHARVFFDRNGHSEFAFFHGEVTFTGGDLAPDFRVVPGHTAQGSLRVTVCGNVVYCNPNLAFSVHDCNDPTNDREKWNYNAGPKEKVTFRWKETQEFKATNDPKLPKSAATGNKNVGKLSSTFIHTDETRYRFDFKDANLPIEIRINGVKLLSVNSANQVSTAYPYWKNGKMVEVLFPDRLQPGDVIVYDNDSNSANGVIYTQSVSADGNCTDEFFNAGGKFFFKVPVTGLNINCPSREAKIEFTIGQPGATVVGCGMDTISLSKTVGHCHKFSSHGDDPDEDACENDVEDDD